MRRELEAAAAVIGGERLHRGRLIGDVASAVAVEFEEQRRRDRITGLRIAVDGVELDLVEQLDPGDRDAELNRRDDRFHRTLDRVERAHRRGDRFRQGMQPQRHLGDHAERAFRSDEQPRQVVAGRRLARARAGRDHRAVGQHHRQPQHVLAHRAVADRGRAGRARRGHAADGRVGAGIDGEGEAGVVQRLVQLQPCHPGFDGHVEILDADARHLVHLAEIDRHAAADRVDVPFQRRPGAERHDRQPMRGGDPDDRGDLGGGLRKTDDVGRRGGVVRLAVAVMFPDGDRVVGARSEQLLELACGREDGICGGWSGHAAMMPSFYRFFMARC